MGLISSKEKEAQNQYRQHYINAMSEMVQCAIGQFTVEEHPKLIYANDKIYEIIGYTREEFENVFDNQLLKIVHEYDYDRIIQFFSELMLFGTQKEFDVRIRRKDGQVRWISCNIKRTINADAVPVFLVSVVDITEKISYQKRIDELSENIPCGLARISISKNSTNVLFANYLFYQMFSDDDAVKKKLFECPEFMDKIYNPVFRDDRACPLKESFEIIHNYEDKENCYIKVLVNYVGKEFENPVYLFTFEDITGEKNLKSRQNKLLSKLSGGYISILFDDMATCDSVSASFNELFETTDKLLSDGLFSVFAEEEREPLKDYIYPKVLKGEALEFSGHIQSTKNEYNLTKIYGISNGEKNGYPYYRCYIFKFDDNSFFGNKYEKPAELDELTGFYDKRYIGEIIDVDLAKSISVEDGVFAIVMLQNFAEINERYGYLFGDNLLSDIALLMRKVFGPDAIIGRTGGMEFSLLLYDISKEDFSKMCEKLCSNISNIYVGEDDQIVLKCKVGITFIEEEDFYQNMYNRAHIVLYRLLHDSNNKYSADYLYDEDADIDIENIITGKNDLVMIENTENNNSQSSPSETEEFKNEFMSRMSHEIRTPMNAISGMADMLLASGLSGMNLEYANMIKSASNNLICIVDDILDISKMETGKIEITPEDYSIRTMIEDMSALINSRLHKKDISFTVYVNPDLPKVLYGDEKRIRQIVMNILSNAVKFTHKGFIRLSIDFTQCENDEIELCISVKDSGIGIHRKDLGKLFERFSQVDSRRNRNADGVGLGLAISKQIAEYMGGKIKVESESGIGSKFTFTVRQSVRDHSKIVEISNADRYSLLIYEKDKYYRMELKGILDELKIKSKFVDNKKEFVDLVKEKKFSHVFFDYGRAFYDLKFTIEKNSSVNFVAMIGRDVAHPQILDCNNYDFIYKPVNIYELESVLNGQKDKETESLQKFIAKDLKVLIIDDNPVNLKVAQGLISSYQCKITTALSGFEALELLTEEQDYDILFIDHMMPSMDGVETLHMIRNNFGEYGKNVPAVALTANVLQEARKLFEESGFQGFLAKPIISKNLHEIMDRLVPEDKKKMLDSLDNKKFVKNISEEDIARVAMKGVDVESGLRCCGNNVSDYLQIISVVLASGKIKVNELKKYAEEKNYEMYGIEAHALKSVAASIGAIKQSDLAREHEYAVKEKRYNVIDKEYQKLINGYQRLLTQIQSVLDKEENRQHNNLEKIEVEPEVWKSKIEETIDSIFKFEQRHAKELLKELSGYKLPDKIRKAVDLASEKMKIYEDESAQKILEDAIKKEIK